MIIAALKWITSLLSDNDIPYLVCGGFAAFVYGSKRTIHDIDIFVPEEHFNCVVNLGTKYISKPAKHYFEEAEGWHVKYVQFKYEDIKIEVGSAKDVEIFDSALGRWVELSIDFSKVKYHSVYDFSIPLMAKEDLVNYKNALGRPVDLQDVEAMLLT